MESIRAHVCARIGRGPIPVVRELLLFGTIGSIAGWRSLRFSSLTTRVCCGTRRSAFVGGGMGASRETAVMAP
jgi:hypothetical protein